MKLVDFQQIINATAVLKKAFRCLYHGSHQIRHSGLVIQQRVKPWTDTLFILIEWKRHPAHYLTGLSWLFPFGYCVFCLEYAQWKQNMLFTQSRLPASHVTGAQILQVKRMWNAMMSLYECASTLMCGSQPLLDSRQTAGRWTWWLPPGPSWLPRRLSEWRTSPSPADLRTHTHFKTTHYTLTAVRPRCALVHLRRPGPASRAAAEGRRAGWSAAVRWSWPSTAPEAADPGSAPPCWAAEGARAARHWSPWCKNTDMSAEPSLKNVLVWL